MTITEFLLARIADDEVVARDWAHHLDQKVQINGGGSGYESLVSPARVLAECEAKRRIVVEHELTDWQGKPSCWLCAYEFSWGKEPTEEQQPCTTLRAVALPYADHPDYDQAWRT